MAPARATRSTTSAAAATSAAGPVAGASAVAAGSSAANLSGRRAGKFLPEHDAFILSRKAAGLSWAEMADAINAQFPADAGIKPRTGNGLQVRHSRGLRSKLADPAYCQAVNAAMAVVDPSFGPVTAEAGLNGVPPSSTSESSKRKRKAGGEAGAAEKLPVKKVRKVAGAPRPSYIVRLRVDPARLAAIVAGLATTTTATTTAGSTRKKRARRDDEEEEEPDKALPKAKKQRKVAPAAAAAAASAAPALPSALVRGGKKRVKKTVRFAVDIPAWLPATAEQLQWLRTSPSSGPPFFDHLAKREDRVVEHNRSTRSYRVRRLRAGESKPPPSPLGALDLPPEVKRQIEATTEVKDVFRVPAARA